jgi:hypothetical protein
VTYAFGAAVRLSTEIRDADRVLVTPVSITLTIQLPDGTTAGPITPTSDGVGLYHHDYTSAQAGRHIARWTTTGPQGADESSFDVAELWHEAGIIALSEAKQQLNIDPSDTDYDEEIQGFARSITEVCERHVGALARTTRVEKHRGGRAVVLMHSPVLTLTSVVAIETSGTDQSVADLDLDQPTGIVTRKDGRYMQGPFRVTYVSGQTSIPAHVRQAALIILQHMWETQRGTTGGVRVGGSDEAYDPRFGFSIPRRAQELLGDEPLWIG